MKNNLFAATILVACCLLTSCGPTLKDKDARIDELIKEHQYEDAREFAKSNFTDGALYGNLSRRLTKIAEAQFEEIFEDQDYKELKEIKREVKKPYAYQRMFFNYFKKILNRGNYDFIFETFEDWNVFYEFHNEYDQWPHNEAYLFREPKVYDDEFMIKVDDNRNSLYENGPYNAEVRFFNVMIDQTLERLIEENDIENIKQFIRLYKPFAVMKSKTKLPSNNYSKDHGTYEHHYVCDLENTAKEDALKRIKEAGIEL